MKAEIITIGDELLIGQVVDTNSAWMAERLNEVGIALHQITSVHDDRQHILTAIEEAFSRADIVLTTGGLAHLFSAFKFGNIIFADIHYFSAA